MTITQKSESETTAKTIGKLQDIATNTLVHNVVKGNTMGKIKDLMIRVEEAASDLVIDMDDEIRIRIEDMYEDYANTFEGMVEDIASDMELDGDDIDSILEQSAYEIYMDTAHAESEFDY